jgi:hypothetical protein
MANEERYNLKKEFEETVEELITQLVVGVVLIYAMSALGVPNLGKVAQELYEQLAETLDESIQELVSELKSTDGFKEIIAMFELLIDLGYWLDNLTVWLSSSSSRASELDSLQDAMDFLNESVEEFHSFMEEVDEIVSPDQNDAIEPNNPADE